MNIRKLLNPNFYIPRYRAYKEAIEYDIRLYLSWGERDHMNRYELNTPEWQYIRCFRKARVNYGNLWGQYYNRKLDRLTRKTGIWIPPCITCGKGITIGHWGRIIVNPRAVIGDDFSISSGAVIGRDIRGKRKGTPVLGNRVCVKSNAIIVGNVTIGDDVLIGPNAFVNFDVPSHSVVIGNPATVHHRDNATEGHIGVVNAQMD